MVRTNQNQREDGSVSMNNDAENLLTVSQVHKLTGATPRQLSYWDKQGVLCPKRTGEGISNNRRLYDTADIERVRDVLLLQRIGLKLDEIRDVLDAPEDERQSRIAACADELHRQYTSIQKSILLSTVAQTRGTDALKESASLIESFSALEDSFASEENLKMLARWRKSHTDRDVQKLMSDLHEVGEGFESLGCEPSWHDLQLQLVHFCDVWGERFGWPTIGGMLELYMTFSTIDGSPLHGELQELFGEEALQLMSEGFLLAWTSATLENLDEALAHLYMHLRDLVETDKEVESRSSCYEAVQKAAEVLCAILCEAGNDPHLAAGTLTKEGVKAMHELNDEVFELLVYAALDDNTSDYLNLEELSAIDGPGLETAKAMLDAYIDDTLADWLSETGWEQLELRMRDWVDDIKLQWLQLQAETLSIEEFLEMSQALEDDGANDAEFGAWFEEWFSEAYADPPEARWATEDESCTHEKEMRELLEGNE